MSSSDGCRVTQDRLGRGQGRLYVVLLLDRPVDGEAWGPTA